jgi:hypothetical protein
MKTAVYICGLLKTFEHTFKSINETLILPNNCDVYVCVWDRLGIDKKYSKVKTIKIQDRAVTEDDIFKFKNVVKFKIVPFLDNCTDKINFVEIPPKVKNKHPVHYYSTIPLSYMVNKCHRMNSGEYDTIVKIRPDLMINAPLNLSKLMPRFGLGSCKYKINAKTQVSDKFVGGDRNAMDHYCNFFNTLNYYWKNCDLVGERLLMHHMKNSNIPITTFPAPIKVIRENIT